MQKSFQEVKHLIGDEKRKNKKKALQRRISGVNALCCFGLFFDAERFRFSAGSQQILLYISALYHQTQTAADVPEVIRHAFEADG